MNKFFPLFLSLLFFLGCAKKEAAANDASPKTLGSSTIPLNEGQETTAQHETIPSFIEAMHNPFLTVEEEASLGETGKTILIDYLAASAIFYSPSGKSRVIIEGKILEKGNSIDNKEIVEIQPEAVILKDTKAEYIVKLKELRML